MVSEKAVELAHVHPGLHIVQGKFRSFCRREKREPRFLFSTEEFFNSSREVHTSFSDIFAGVVCIPFKVSTLQARKRTRSVGDPALVFERLFISTLGYKVWNREVLGFAGFLPVIVLTQSKDFRSGIAG